MKISIISLIALLFICVGLRGNSLGIKTGIYDFTDEATRDFYKVGYSVLGDYSFYTSPFIQFDIQTGLTYSTTDYNGKRHNQFVFPLQATYISYILGDGANLALVPYFGVGVGAYYSLDTAQALDKDYKKTTYGYHFLMGFAHELSEKTSLTCELKNNIIMSHYLEDIEISGINLLVGLRYEL